MSKVRNSSSAYTPGPWREHKGLITSDRFGVIAAMQDGVSKEQQRSNARLIAAAPELIEACKLAADAIGRTLDLEYGAGNDEFEDVQDLAASLDKVENAIAQVENQ